MAAAIAIALPLLELEFAAMLLSVSLVANDAGISTATPVTLFTMVMSPAAKDLATAPALTTARVVEVAMGEPTGVPPLPFKIGNPFHSCVSAMRIISCLSC